LPLQFGPLEASDDRAAFSCGRPELDDWFRQRAGQDQRRQVSQVFVCRDEHGVAGYYTLSAFSIITDDLPGAITKKLPRYDTVPAVLLGRLARHERLRGTGLGELLMADAIERVIQASQNVAMYAIVVDAKDDKAATFYKSLGFQPFPSRANRLFLPLATILKGRVAAAADE
jgi:predicted N-acetyltransferase YhbS